MMIMFPKQFRINFVKVNIEVDLEGLNDNLKEKIWRNHKILIKTRIQ